MTTLYPNIEPYTTHQLTVGQEHVLMVEESGNPNGIPVIFLHGGPGGHCKTHHRCFFNPNHYRIVLFDQRGAGRSTPIGCLKNNTTWDLLNDMEIIRKQLTIEKWLIFGGSWGTTLGLLYAQQYPENVLGLILRGTFLARQRDINWFYTDGGVNCIFPQQWQAFTQWLPKIAEGKELIAMYYNYLTSQDKAVANKAALAWAAWHGCVVSYGQFPAPTETSDKLLHEARIECHYFFNDCFLEDNYLLQHIDSVTHIPAIFIHGQQDLVCPLESSYLLTQNLPKAQLRIVPTGGHLAHDPDMISTLVTATDEMAKQLT